MFYYNSNALYIMACEEYYRNRRIYEDALIVEGSLRKRIDECIAEQQIKNAEIEEDKSTKINLEKRVRELDNIIADLEGSNGNYGINVPESISKANKSIIKADSSYKNSIQVTGDISVASLITAFKITDVTLDEHSNKTLIQLKKERNRVSELITEITKAISAAETAITALKNKVSGFSYSQCEVRRTINRAYYDMEFYRNK